MVAKKLLVDDNHGKSLCQTNMSPGARFSKVAVINGPGKLSPFTLKTEVSIVFAYNTTKLSVNETKWSSLLARTRALIPYISI